MPRWTGAALISGFVFQVIFIASLMLLIRTQADAQTAEAVGEAGAVISEFTRSVDVFNFVIVASFVGYAGSLWVILRLNKSSVESSDTRSAAFMAEAAETRRAHEREVSVLTGIMLKMQENTLASINALVKVSDFTDAERIELRNTNALVQSFMDTTLPTITNAYRDTDLARHDRDSIISGFRQSLDTFNPKFIDMMERTDELLAELRARAAGASPAGKLAKEGD